MFKDCKLFNSLTSIIMSIILLFQGLFAGEVSEVKLPETEKKNVILMIGDGMGFNTIEKARTESSRKHFAMDEFTLRGESKTASNNSLITDSAAGGSALAVGLKINNTVAVYPNDMKAAKSYPMSLSELAISQNKSAGVVTTDSTHGATPADFTAHTKSRNNEKDITTQQINSDLTLIWGRGCEYYDESAASSNGFTTITNKAEMDALTSSQRSFGQFTDELWHEEAKPDMPTLAEMTTKAIDLLDDDSDGFFLMVEGAHIDKQSHDMNSSKMEDALISFDDAVRVALEYAKGNTETVVIVTADHETGGITQVGSSYIYTAGLHTDKNVPLLVYGCNDFIKTGEAIENCVVSQKIAAVMGCKKFPIKVNKAA